MKTIATHQIIITDPYVSRAQANLEAYLLSLEAEKFLYEIYKVAGLKPLTNSGYQGWERSNKINFRGHFFGHFMSALALAYQSASDEVVAHAFKEKMRTAVGGLAEAQAAYGKRHPESAGYISAFRETALDEVEGLPVTPEEKENCLVPWYNLHKVLVGLMDIAEYMAEVDPQTSQLALTIVSRFGDYIHCRMLKLTDKQQMLKIEYGGMNDGLYRLFELTGKKEHAEAAEYFDETDLFQKLAAGQDVLPGKHANTTIPKLIGALKRYRVFQEEDNQQYLSTTEIQQLPLYLKAAENFWEIVVTGHTYCTGGNSQSEHFHEPHELYHDAVIRNGDCTCETCNSHNMLKLSRSLYEVTGEAKYLDYYERTYINAILASQNPETGMMMYFQPMGAGYNKVYNRPYDEFWCCTGTGVESFAKLADTYYYTDGDWILVNLYFSNEVCLPKYNVLLRQKTDRKTGHSRFTVTALDPEQPVQPIKMGLRLPSWAKEWRLTNQSTGASLTNEIKAGFILPQELFAPGDSWELTTTMAVKVTAAPDNPRYLAFEYGPYVLAAGLGGEAVAEDAPNGILVRVGTKQPLLPDTLTVATEDWIEQAASHLLPETVPGKLLGFRLNEVVEDLVFTPYYEMHGERYGIYFEVLQADSEAAQQAIRLKKEALRKQQLVAAELHNFDENNSEYAKSLAYEKSEVEASWGRRYRQAQAAGWFSYEFAIPADKTPNFLKLTLKADEVGKVLQVVFNDDPTTAQLLAVEDFAEADFYDITLELPAPVKDRELIKVTFSGSEGQESPRLYGITFLTVLTYGSENELQEVLACKGEVLSQTMTELRVQTTAASEEAELLLELQNPAGLLFVDGILIDDSKPRRFAKGTHELVVTGSDHLTRHSSVLIVE